MITLHTPGPWSVEENHDILWIWGPNKGKLVTLINQDDRATEEVKEENRGNAHLISNAPLLLNTLVLAQATLTGTSVSDQEKKDAIEIIQSVIDKTLGRKEVRP